MYICIVWTGIGYASEYRSVGAVAVLSAYNAKHWIIKKTPKYIGFQIEGVVVVN